MHEQPLEDVLVPPDVCAPQPTGLVKMRTRSLEQFSAFAEKPFPAVAADAPSIRVDRVALRFLIDPRLGPTIRFADVDANLQCLQIVHRRSTVVALVGDDLFDHRHRSSVTAATASSCSAASGSVF